MLPYRVSSSISHPEIDKYYFVKLPCKCFVVSMAAALALCLFGCGRKETNVARGVREQILFKGNGTEPAGLDPHVVTGVPEHNILSAMFEGLVSENPVDLHPEPGVAKSWEISEDGRTYTFHFRDNAMWSNGDPVRARDFVYSFRRILSPGLGAEYAYMLYPLRNGKAFNTGKIDDFSEVGVKADDDLTLIIELENPTPYFLELLNHYSWWPVHPPTIEKFGKIDQRGTQWTRPGNIVTNGAFTLKDWQINRHIVVEKNPLYWDAEKVKLTEIHFLPIDSADTEERAFRTGYIHLTETIPMHRINYYMENRPELMRLDPYLGTYYYRINTRVPPLGDKRVRRALALTINREDITRYITRGGQLPAYFLTPPNTSGYTARARFEYNVEQARELLAEAGFPGGRGFPDLEILYNTSEGHRSIAEAIQQMWKEALNIKVKLLNEEWKVYLASVANGDFQISRAGWIGDYNDPNTFLDMWLTGGGNNMTGWSNSEYDQLIELAGRTIDTRERFEYFQQAEAILMDELPVIPIYFYVRNLLIHPSVKGWHPTILDHHPYKFVSLMREGPDPGLDNAH